MQALSKEARSRIKGDKTVNCLSLQILTEARLELGSISFDSGAPEAPGRIVGQYPPVGYSLRAGDTVELRVAGDASRVNDGLDFRQEQAGNGEPELL